MPSRVGFVLQVLSLAESIRSARHIRGASNAGADDFAFLELGGRGRAGRRRARQRAYGGGGGGGGGGSGASDAFVNLKPAEAAIHYPGKPVMQPDGTEGAYCVCRAKGRGGERPSRHECHLTWRLSGCSVSKLRCGWSTCGCSCRRWLLNRSSEHLGRKRLGGWSSRAQHRCRVCVVCRFGVV
jgi:hypothetical protein